MWKTNRITSLWKVWEEAASNSKKKKKGNYEIQKKVVQERKNNHITAQHGIVLYSHSNIKHQMLILPKL